MTSYGNTTLGYDARGLVEIPKYTIVEFRRMPDRMHPGNLLYAGRTLTVLKIQDRTHLSVMYR